MSDILLDSRAPRPEDVLDSRDSPVTEGLPTWDPDQAYAVFSVEAAIGDGGVSSEYVEGLPIALVRLYADIAVRHAFTREVDPGVWVATVAGLDGAWGDGENATEAETSLHEAIIGWVAVKRRSGVDDIPLMEGIDLNPRP